MDQKDPLDEAMNLLHPDPDKAYICGRCGARMRVNADSPAPTVCPKCGGYLHADTRKTK